MAPETLAKSAWELMLNTSLPYINGMTLSFLLFQLTDKVFITSSGKDLDNSISAILFSKQCIKSLFISETEAGAPSIIHTLIKSKFIFKTFDNLANLGSMLTLI